MRIQHNIMAMNAFRNYNSNTSALGRNLEKLSSGYKINRAGDDAAGLAISEKMRAQISGLKQAQSNVKDGISLVKTAEGALQEVQDMMNRMVTLATQSANGTYDNDVDRKNLQKEVEALKSEIDRIADSANFNGTKLLDGSLDSNGAQVEVAQSKLDAVTLTGIESTTDPLQYHKDATAASKTSFTVDLGNINHNATDPIGNLVFALNGTDKTDAGKVVNALSKADGSAITYSLGSGQIDGADVAKAIMDAIGPEGKVHLNMMADDTNYTYANATKIEYMVEIGGENNDQLIFTMTDDGYNTAVAAGEDNLFRGNFTSHIAANMEKAWVDGVVDSKGNALNTGNTDANSNGFVDSAANNGAESFAASLYAGLNGKDTLSQAVSNIKTGGSGAEQLFQGMINKEDISVSDGAGFKVGNEYYVWALTEETRDATYGDNVKVVDLTDIAKTAGISFTRTAATEVDGTTVGATGKAGVDGYTAYTEAISRFVEAAKDNEMFHVGTTRNGADIVITEKATNPSDADLTNANGVKKVFQKFDNFSEISTVTKEAGAALTLQIGDTADGYNKIDVAIKDMHVKALGIGDLDISKQEDAQVAIEKIKNAINTVSGTRGDLGAIQNRLEHTTNNLAIMTENIQDAESTIRDVDIADEMTTYTKNNILLQSAQAMLAQANQMPQGVLQLLQ